VAKKKAQTTRAALRQALHDAGMRATAARVAVLGALRDASVPLSHAEVAELVDDAGCDRATVFRNLVALADAGLARRTDHGDRTWRFEAADADHPRDLIPHPHFLCTECGAVLCVDGIEIKVPKHARLPRAVRTSSVEVQLRGVCDSCG
jgi:Fur family ferric uptake transcriptional regulator